MSWIQTRDGKRFDLLKPDPNVIDPDTLAVVLARTCRFGGHCREFYSVAQHSLLVESLVYDVSLKLPALLHDAHEAYWGFGDILRPARWAMPDDAFEWLRVHKEKVDTVVGQRFGIDPWSMLDEKVKHADNVALATEARDLMEEPPCPWEELPSPHFDIIEPWDTDEAYRRFTARLYELWGE